MLSTKLVGQPVTNAPSLTRWGMSAPADLVYRALMALGPASLEDLAAWLRTSQRLVKRALEELRAAQACELENTRRPRWRAASPSVVSAVLQQRHRETAVAARGLRHQIARLGGVALSDHELSAALGSSIKPLFGGTQVRGRIGELAAAKRCEWLAMVPEPAFDRQTVKTAAPLDRVVCANGRVFSLGVPAAAEDRSGGHTEALVALGLQYRELPALPTKLIIIDRATALMPIDPGDAGKGSWEITAAPVVHRLLHFYLGHWNEASAPQKRWTPPMTLTPRERTVLALLAEDHTDDSVAALLGLSRRTIAYTVADLMERYGAHNRFQLGLFLRDHDGPTAIGGREGTCEAEDDDKENHETA